MRDSSDGDQLEALYLRHGPEALRLAYLLTGDRELAEDLAQEAFVRVARSLHGLRNANSFHRYLRRTVVNLANSQLRRRRVERAYRKTLVSSAAADVSSGDVATRQAVRDAIAQLPARQRTVTQAGRPSAGPVRPVTAYVANGGSGTVTPIRTVTGAALAPIKVGGHMPFAIAVTPDGKTAYVANVGSGTVTPIRTATGAALAPIKVGQDPEDLAITPDGKTVYVVNTGSSSVTAIRVATNTALAPVNTGRDPDGIAITP